MKPCEYCGIERHQPWDDGLVECRNRLSERLADVEAEREREQKISKGLMAALSMCKAERDEAFEVVDACQAVATHDDRIPAGTRTRDVPCILKDRAGRAEAERDAARELAAGWEKRAEFAAEQYRRRNAEGQRAEAELSEVRAALKEFAEGECEYGDGCPSFGTRHGRCVPCKARAALAKGKESKE